MDRDQVQILGLKVVHNFEYKTSSHDSTNGKTEEGRVAVCHVKELAGKRQTLYHPLALSIPFILQS